MENRDFAIKITTILRYITVGLIVLTFASWALPCFTYSGVAPKEVQSTISMWGAIGLTTRFPQFELLLGIKFVKMATISVPLVMFVSGVVTILSGLTKKGIGTAIMPLIFSGYGLIGYFTSDFLALMNHPSSRIIQIVLVAITLVVTLVSIFFYVVEMRTRPADYYLPKMGF